MAYMKRNVNFGLLFILLALVICIAGLSIYYQTTFKSLYFEYRERAAELRQVSETLMMERDRLNQTSQQLIVREQREQELTTIYDDTSQERDALKEQADKLSAQLQATMSDLTKTRIELAESKTKLAQAEVQVLSLETQRSNLYNNINDLNKRISDLESELDECMAD